MIVVFLLHHFFYKQADSLFVLNDALASNSVLFDSKIATWAFFRFMLLWHIFSMRLMLIVWVVIFKKPSLRLCLLVKASFLYYNYCPIRLFCHLILYFLFIMPVFLHFLFLFSTSQRQVFQPNVLYSIPNSSFWKFLSGIFSAIFSYLFPFLHSSETPNTSIYSLQISYLTLESSLSSFSRGWYRFWGVIIIHSACVSHLS